MKSLMAILAAVFLCLPALAEVRIKELTRIQGVRDYSVIGYGLVVGLAGSGDSERNRATRQALVNTLKNSPRPATRSMLRSRPWATRAACSVARC